MKPPRIALALLVLPLAACGGRGDPDPGGHIRADLGSVVVAMPADATGVSRQEVGGTWGSCAGRPGTAGWSYIGLTITFSSSLDPATVLARADAAMLTAGWADVTDQPTNLAPGLTWRGTVAGDDPAVASLSLIETGWQLSAQAPARGQQERGC